MRKLKIVFLGTPDFAVHSLDCLNKSEHEIVGVVTMPDKKMGRGRQLKGSAVKDYAEANNLPLLQPPKLKDEEFLKELSNWKADIFVVVAFRMLPEAVWNMPELGTVNVHGSLLPQYRGAAPINWAIINGEKETGVTVFRLKHEIDTGDILLRKSMNISTMDNASSVHDKLMNLGGLAIVEAMDIIAKGNPEYLPQLEATDLKPAPKIFKETCEINWNQPVLKIYDFIRGLSPYPASWTNFTKEEKEYTLKIYEAEVRQEKVSKSGILETDDKSFIRISGTDGWVYISSIQLSGKKKMPVTDLLRGFKFEHISF